MTRNLPPKAKKRTSPLLLIVLLFIGGCCGLSMIIGIISTSLQAVGLLPTNTPRPTATATRPPTNTPIPTNTPPATPTPVPPATPTPEPTPPTPEPAQADTQPSSPSAPLGITQASLKSVYEDLGFTFTDAAPVDGQPRIMGKSPTAYVELIGPPENLTQAGVMFAATQNEDENTANIIYMVTLLNGAVYGWDGGVDWLTKSLPEATEKGMAATTYQNKSIELTASKELGLIILTVKGISEPSAQAPAPDTTAPIVTAANNVNLRSGPGTDYDQVGTLQAGQTLPLIGRNFDSSWWQVTTPTGPAWVNAGVVTAANVPDNLPIIQADAANRALPTAAPQQTIQASPTPLPPAPPVAPDIACDCSANLYNCKGSFNTDAEAQGCYLHCLNAGAGDIHDLDRDGDGNACEWGK